MAWCASALVYFGLALESSDLGGNMDTNFMLSNVADTVAVLASLFLIDRYGRRKQALLSFFSCGVLLAAIAAVPTTWSHATSLRLALALVGKVLINFVFCILYIWSAELYPTVIRSQGMTICLISARIGASTAPFLTSVLRNLYEPLPFITMACASVLACRIFDGGSL